jgi:hypothetical protein
MKRNSGSLEVNRASSRQVLVVTVLGGMPSELEEEGLFGLHSSC